VEGVCAELGIKAIEPLWGRNTEEVLLSFIDSVFEAVIVCAQSELIDEDWIGRRVDKALLEYLKSHNVDPCGENGEYHTLVVNGPFFRRRIQLIETGTIARDRYWFLDTVSYELGRGERT
jgi:diphthine-ammonia ligase